MNNWFFILLLGIGVVLTAGCNQPATEPHIFPVTPAMTMTVPVQPLTGPDAVTSQKIDNYIIALTDTGRFSGTVFVARGDTVLLSKGYGMANYEFSVPNTPQTVMPIASNTKQLTGAAIMKLEEQERLNITDPVRQYSRYPE